MKRRTICADSPYGKENCPYAKVIEEQGSFPGRMDITYPNGRKVTCDYEEKSRYAVYCTHPKRKKIFVGIVEPYGVVCKVPANCPEIEKKTTLLQRFRSFF